jgi:hypothetical protein
MSKGRNLAKLAVSNTGGIQVSALSTVVGAAPAALDTFNELAQALNNDANFATTVNNAIAAKQSTLVSGTNIKTINSTSLLGSGNITVQPTLVSGTNIKTVNGNSLLGSGDITISGGGGSAATTSALGSVYASTQDTVYSTGTYGYGNTIIGYGAYASGNNQNTRYNLVGGVSAYANSYDGVALGYSSHVMSSSSTALGANAKTNSGSSNATAIGNNATVNVNSSYSTVLGAGSSINDYVNYSIVAGYGSIAYGSYSTTIGSANDNRGTYSFVGGYANTAWNASALIGNYINDNGYTAIVLKSGSGSFTVAGGDGFYVPSIGSGQTGNVLYFDTNTCKITYGALSGGSGGQLAQLSDVSISQPVTSGQVLTFQNGLWRNVTPSAGSGGSGSGASLRTNGFGVTDIFAPMNTFTLSSSTEASAFMTAYQGLQQPLMNFSNSTGLFTMMILNAAWNGNWYSLPPDWNPSLMYPNITQTGPTTFSYTSSQPMQTMPVSNFPQYLDNDGRMWLQVNLGQLNYMQMSYNAQFSGPTSAKVWPNMYQGAGADPIQTLITTLQQLATIDSGVHDVVIRVSGYNAINGQNTMTGFFSCTNITYSGNELSFSYVTAQDYGYAPYNSLMFGIDIQ